MHSSASSNESERQDARQPPRQHGLAGAGRADHQQVVPAGGGDLERAPRDTLPAQIAQIERRVVKGGPASRSATCGTTSGH